MPKDILSYFGIKEGSSRDIIIHETCVNSILVKSKIYGVDYAVNPYVGCAHGCVYCYARYIFERKGINPSLWGKVVFVKRNAPSVLLREIRVAKKGLTLLSSVTDAYQFIEKEYMITRKLLDILTKHQYPITILTKSDLVLRDLDLIKRTEAEIGFTIVTIDDKVREIFEPKATPIEKRLLALKKITNMGFHTYVFIGPILPIFTEKDLTLIFEEVNEYGVQRVLVDKLNLKAKNWIFINEALNNFSSKIKYEFWKKAKSKEFYELLRKRIIQLGKKYNIRIDFCY